MKGSDLQSADSARCRDLVATKSEGDFRYCESISFVSANLIIHQGVTNILHQIIQLLRVLGVVEETWEISPACY